MIFGGFVACSDEGPEVIPAPIYTDSDGDGLTDSREANMGADAQDPCDPARSSSYSAYDAENMVWAAADCDGDGLSNGVEVVQGTNPYADAISDTDGDGLTDFDEELQGSDPANPCDPVQDPGYDGFDSENELWAQSDCDSDGLLNGEGLTSGLNPYEDERVFVSDSYTQNLSEMNIFEGPLDDLKLSRTALFYDLNTSLFTDYAHKLRSISLPKDGVMRLTGDGFLEFPNGTVISKTFYYYWDERNPDAGKRIIETRVLIKKNNVWQVGNYVWNPDQQDAVLDGDWHYYTVDWTDAEGQPQSVYYAVPSTNACITCHNKFGEQQLIGPKARALNSADVSNNFLRQWMDRGLLVSDISLDQVTVLPDAFDLSYGVTERARAYMDMNCAHCHRPDNNAYTGNLDLRYETPFDQTGIANYADEIQFRIQTSIPSMFMPELGTGVMHPEGVDLMNAYIDSLN